MPKVELLDNIARNPSLPSPPGVALRVIERASHCDCSMADLSQIISLDPGLCAKILKTVNSAAFGLTRSVTSVQRALAAMGLSATRSLVLSLTMPQMVRVPPQDERIKNFWKTSVAGAILARDLSKRLGRRDADDDMALALLRDLGEVSLQQIFPDQYQRVTSLAPETRLPNLCQWEQHYLGIDHCEVTAFLLGRWGFPAGAIDAVRVHHDPSETTFKTQADENRAYLIHFASLAADLLITAQLPHEYENLCRIAEERYGIDEDELTEFLQPLGQKTQELARIMEVDIGQMGDFPKILALASETLVNLTVAASLENQRSEVEKERAESEARKWRNEAAFDGLTKVFNRRFFEEQLSQLLQRDYPEDMGFGLVFIDLDGFKILNDKFGHPFGDRVLVEVAYSLRNLVRKGDMVARFGGDEFCILVEQSHEDGLRCLADRIWKAINELVIRQQGQEGKVGASIGAMVCTPTDQSYTPQELLYEVDQAMYQAKRAGKNRVNFLNEKSRRFPALQEAV